MLTTANNLLFNYKTKHTRTEKTRENSETKFHNSFPIAGVDITRHANSRTHAKRTFFRTERPLHAKLYKNVEKNNSNMAYNDSWST